MSTLKAAILKSAAQRANVAHGGVAIAEQDSSQHGSPSQVPVAPASGSSLGPQLTSLRRRFDSSVQRHDARFTDSANDWVQEYGSRHTRGRRRGPAATGQQRHPTKRQHRSTDPEHFLGEDLEADLLAVLTEAGLPPRYRPALLNAARRGHVATNPGVLLCQLLRYQSCMEASGLTERQVLTVLGVYPMVLNASPDTLAWHIEELAGMFGAKAPNMIVKRPQLLCASPFTVWSNLSSLATLLDTSVERTQTLVARQPRLLLNSTQALTSRLTDLQDITGLSLQAVQSLVTSQPALLTYHPSTLAQNLEQLTQGLGLSHTKVVKLITRAPVVLMLTQDCVARKVESLAALLHCSTQEAATLVARQPSLLCLSSAVLTLKCTQLATALHTTPEAVLGVIAVNPSLLTLAPDTLSFKLKGLTDALAEARDLVRHTPQRQQPQHSNPRQDSVASTSCSDEGASQQCLQTGGPCVGGVVQHDGCSVPCEAMVEAWHEQLQRSTPNVRAAYGCFSVQRYQRLVTLTQAMLGVPIELGSDVRVAHKSNAVGAMERKGGGRPWSLSKVLRASDRAFEDLLQSL